jgi:hypothetical protein
VGNLNGNDVLESIQEDLSKYLEAVISQTIDGAHQNSLLRKTTDLIGLLLN